MISTKSRRCSLSSDAVESTKHTDVLIVGAGPSGLMMAAQLLRFGVQPKIIDAKRGPDRASKAIAVQARSLELFRQMGLADRLLEAGMPCYGIQVQGQRRPLGKVDFARMENPDTAFPFLHIVGQDRTEKLLLARLTEKACPVDWETRLVSLRQDDNGVQVVLEHEGAAERWACRWLIGADGAGSMVRECLGIRFEGRRYDGRFFLADVVIRDGHHRHVHFFVRERALLGIFPFNGQDRYRIVGELPDDLAQQRQLAYGDVKLVVDRALGFELPVTQCLWISGFSMHRRTAEQFSRQRCFLVGDAAHVHSPVGGQGMNTGLQDAANLAWKLAGVLQGRMATKVLHSYQLERMPVAREVSETTDRALRLLTGVPRWLRPLREVLLAKGLGFLAAKTGRLRKVFGRMAQLDVHYRRSALTVHHATDSGVRAGDRLPFIAVFDEKTKTHTDLHRWCEKPGFILLVLGTISHHQLNVIGQWVRQRYPRQMHLYYLPFSANNQRVFDIFAVKPTGTKTVLIRPDMYIAYINDMLNMGLIDTYMEGVLGWQGGPMDG